MMVVLPMYRASEKLSIVHFLHASQLAFIFIKFPDVALSLQELAKLRSCTEYATFTTVYYRDSDSSLVGREVRVFMNK